MSLIVAVDIGGTFTDLVVCDSKTGLVRFSKSPTTYDDFGAGIFDCVRKAQVDLRDAAFVKHGTTLVINSLLQRSGARTALVTTRGFRDVLEIARGNRTEPFNLRFRRDAPLIPRHLRFEVDQRTDASGNPLRPLNKKSVGELAERLRALDIKAIAVSFINSYANPEDEIETVRLLKEQLPGTFVTAGTTLSREWHEFERTATAAANAYVGPQVSNYISNFDEKLKRGGFGGALLLMGSHGGVISAGRGCIEPITLVESGPVGGCIGTAAYGRKLGLQNLIAFDMGGTTAKCALIERGRYSVDSTYHVGGAVRGIPIKANVIDILEVGMGGGSIASVSPERRLSVGPLSAGSTPGPACYGRGGSEATVTDANLILGRLDSYRFLGGEMRISKDDAVAAVQSNVAEKLGYRNSDAVSAAAAGIIRIAGLTMAAAVKQILTSRGYDPRDFALFCYGGGGPLHGIDLARELNIPQVIVPPEPGNFSAVGMLLADAQISSVRTYVAPCSDVAIQEMEERFYRLEADGARELLRDFGGRGVQYERAAELRYVGQQHTLKIKIEPRVTLPTLRETFDSEYDRRYGHSHPDAAREFVAIHSVAVMEMARPHMSELGRSRPKVPHVPGKRPVYFLEVDRFIECQIFDRYALPHGFEATGPSVIEEYGSVTLVGPTDSFRIGELGEICIECSK